MRSLLILKFLFFSTNGSFLEPYIPSYMYNKFAAFKFGARSGGNDCNQFQCRVPFFGN